MASATAAALTATSATPIAASTTAASEIAPFRHEIRLRSNGYRQFFRLNHWAAGGIIPFAITAGASGRAKLFGASGERPVELGAAAMVRAWEGEVNKASLQGMVADAASKNAESGTHWDPIGNVLSPGVQDWRRPQAPAPPVPNDDDARWRGGDQAEAPHPARRSRAAEERGSQRTHGDLFRLAAARAAEWH
ncbi:hypothetical protein KC352_g41980 [Hortaea werneckii]|nr:hypothetical protein KC352_g41980 [Hortaea werneckii]